MNIHDMSENELKAQITEHVMNKYSMKEYRDEALKSEFVFYGILYLPDMFDEKLEVKKCVQSSTQYFLISDQKEDHIPWPFLISDLMATMPFHSGPYDKDIWEMAFAFMGNKPIYLTHNLWTCDCVDSQYIWDIDTVCCHLCGCVEDEESMRVMTESVGNVIQWKPKSKRIPYLHERFDYPLEQYVFDILTLGNLIRESCSIYHGAQVSTH